MIAAEVDTPFGHYRVIDPVVMIDGFLGLVVSGDLYPGSELELESERIDGTVRFDMDREWWACASTLEELEAFAEVLEWP